MSFRNVVIIAVVLVTILSMTIFPKVIRGIRDNPEVREMIKYPDETFDYFSECKKKVSDTDHCYKAYSAAVQITDSKDCTPSGVELKRKFKRLAEHGTDQDIDEEINKECPPVK